MRIYPLFTLILFLFQGIPSEAQKFIKEGEGILIQGKMYAIKKDQTSIGVGNRTLLILQDGKKYKKLKTKKDGSFSFELGYDIEWTIIWKRKWRYSKSIIMDSRNITEEDKVGGFRSQIDVSFPESMSKKNKYILRTRPIGKAKYSYATNSIEFDFKYTDRIKSMLDK